jgi:hypothetical protein
VRAFQLLQQKLKSFHRGKKMLDEDLKDHFNLPLNSQTISLLASCDLTGHLYEFLIEKRPSMIGGLSVIYRQGSDRITVTRDRSSICLLPSGRAVGLVPSLSWFWAALEEIDSSASTSSAQKVARDRVQVSHLTCQCRLTESVNLRDLAPELNGLLHLGRKGRPRLVSFYHGQMQRCILHRDGRLVFPGVRVNQGIDLGKIRDHVHRLNMRSQKRKILLDCARDGRLEMLRELLAGDHDGGIDGREAAILASERGQLNVVQYLYESGLIDFRKQKDLFCAIVGQGEANVVKWLCEQGSPEIKSQQPAALVRAVREGRLETARFLSGLGVDHDATRSFGLACRSGRLETAKWCLDLGEITLTSREFRDLFLDCGKRLRFEEMRWLYELRGRPLDWIEEMFVDRQSQSWSRSLPEASSKLGIGSSGWTHAVASGHLDLVQWLFGLAQECGIDLRAIQHRALLVCCLRCDRLEMAQWLAGSHALDEQPVDQYFSTACQHNTREFANWIYRLRPGYLEQSLGESPHASLRLTGEVNLSVLVRKCSKKGRLEIVKWLCGDLATECRLREDIDLPGALVDASRKGQLPVVEHLLELKPFTPYDLKEAFALSCVNNCLPVARCLANRVDLDIRALDRLFVDCCLEGSLAVAKWLYAQGHIDLTRDHHQAFRLLAEQAEKRPKDLRKMIDWMASKSDQYEINLYQSEAGLQLEWTIRNWYTDELTNSDLIGQLGLITDSEPERLYNRDCLICRDPGARLSLPCGHTYCSDCFVGAHVSSLSNLPNKCSYCRSQFEFTNCYWQKEGHSPGQSGIRQKNCSQWSALTKG